MKIISREEARAKGLKRYFSGKACKWGHCCERYVSNGVCIKCALGISQDIREASIIKCKANSKRLGIPLVSRKQAIAHDFKKYFTGEPCQNGHIAERWVNAWACTECVPIWHSREYQKHKQRYSQSSKIYRENNKAKLIGRRKEYYFKNAERLKKYNREHNARNRDSSREYNKRYYKENSDKIKKHVKEYAKNNPQKIRALNVKRYWKNPKAHLEHIREWRKNNPEKQRANSHRRRSRKTNAKGSHTGDDIIWLLRKQKYKCIYCHKSLRKEYHVDHIIPLVKNGSDDKDNLQILCPSCNCKKGSKDPIKFAQENGLLL